MMTHAELIAAKGTAEVATKVGRPVPHIRVWKSRGIPRSAYADFLDAFPDVTLEQLKAGAPG